MRAAHGTPTSRVVGLAEPLRSSHLRLSVPVEGPIGHPPSHCTCESFEVGAQLTNDIAGIFSLPNAWRISAKNALNSLAIAFCGGASISGGLASHDNRTTQAASFLGPQASAYSSCILLASFSYTVFPHFDLIHFAWRVYTLPYFRLVPPLLRAER